MKSKMFVAALALWSAAAFALPSFNDVENAVNAGNYPQAEQMMQEVVAAKPGSAKAHYVYAEILAHDAKFDQAARETAQAQQIDPALSFTDPNKFRDFQRLLQREQASPRGGATAGYAPAHAQPQASGLPGWMWGLGFAVIAFMLWRMVSRRTAMMRQPMYGGGGGGAAAAYGPGVGPYGGGGGYGPMGAPMGGAGSGLLGTGLAAAGGLAGGMLLEKYLEGQHGNAGNGGAGVGSFDNGSGQAATDLENRPIDFGSGNDWGGGGGDSGGGGGTDFTPSGGGGGGDDGGGW